MTTRQPYAWLTQNADDELIQLEYELYIVLHRTPETTDTPALSAMAHAVDRELWRRAQVRLARAAAKARAG